MEIKKFKIDRKEDFYKTELEKSLKYLGENNMHIDYVSVGADEEIPEQKLVPVIRFNLFDKFIDITYGFSTRYGGVSKEHLSSMNLSFSRGDDEQNVLLNHKIFSKAVGYDYKKLVLSDQVHDVKIKHVTEADCGKGIIKDSDIKGIDGLVTNKKGIPLMTFYADCVPLLFYDPVKKVVATAHSGWKGTVNKIGAVMINEMVSKYDCQPEDIYCAIAPSICMSCYEISEDVATEFKNSYSLDIYNDIIIDKSDGKFQLDLHKACYYNFIEAGILKNHISMPDLCTCCNSEFLFSHRKTNGKRGNLAAVIMLN